MESKSPSEFQTGAAIVFQIYQTPPRTVCVCDSDCRNISHTRTQAQLRS